MPGLETMSELLAQSSAISRCMFKKDGWSNLCCNYVADKAHTYYGDGWPIITLIDCWSDRVGSGMDWEGEKWTEWSYTQLKENTLGWFTWRWTPLLLQLNGTWWNRHSSQRLLKANIWFPTFPIFSPSAKSGLPQLWHLLDLPSLGWEQLFTTLQPVGTAPVHVELSVDACQGLPCLFQLSGMLSIWVWCLANI